MNLARKGALPEIPRFFRIFLGGKGRLATAGNPALLLRAANKHAHRRKTL